MKKKLVVYSFTDKKTVEATKYVSDMHSYFTYTDWGRKKLWPKMRENYGQIHPLLSSTLFSINTIQNLYARGFIIPVALDPDVYSRNKRVFDRETQIYHIKQDLRYTKNALKTALKYLGLATMGITKILFTSTRIIIDYLIH